MKKAAPKITNIKMILIEVDVTSKLGGIGYPLKNDIVAFLSTKKTLRAFVRLTGQAGDRKKCDSYYLCFELLYGRC